MYYIWLSKTSNGKLQNIILFPKLFWPTVRKRRLHRLRIDFEIQDWRLRICKFFEITWNFSSNSERSVQFLKQNVFLTCSWRFVRSNTLQQLKFKWEKLIGNSKPTGKVRKVLFSQKLFWVFTAWLTCWIVT